MKANIKLLIAGFGIAVLGGVSAITISKVFENKITSNTNSVLENSSINAPTHLANYKDIDTRYPKSFELAAEMSLNAVVHIKTEVSVNQPIDPFYHFFYGVPSPHNKKSVKSSGSGVIISDDGYIVTNNHVIDNANKISVTLNNKKSYVANVIGTDPSTDLALLKIEDSNLPFIQYGNSNNTKVGEWVIAVGNPYNLTSTVTAGIISAKGRDINILRNDPYNGLSAIESFIQTDAAVNPGNSGGALVSTTGELIGINSAIQSNTGSFTGYSFAIPVNIVKKVVDDLKEFGNVQRVFMGVSISNLNNELASNIGTENLNGVYIGNTTEGGSAKKAGIKSGDVIRKVGTKKIHNVAELQEQLSQFRPGEKIDVTIERDNKILRIPVSLKNYKGDDKIVSNNDVNIMKVLGAQFGSVEKKELKSLKIKNGIKVKEVFNGKFRKIGVKKGFIITKINHQPISSINELSSAINNANGGILMEGIYENGKREFYGFGLK